METVHSLDTLTTIIGRNKLCLLYISSENCSVCHALLPQIKEMLKQFPDIYNIRLSVDDIPEIAGEFSIFTVPVVIVFHEGKEMFRKARFIPIEQLKQQLSRLISNLH